MSNNNLTTAKSYCRYCERELHGRAGKMFCNVDCKNNFNSRIRSAQRARETRLFPSVIKSIKTNYRILLNYNIFALADNEYLQVRKEELKKLGFDPRYCTGAAMDGQDLWKYCFDFCWKDEGEWLCLKYSPIPSSNHQ